MKLKILLVLFAFCLIIPLVQAGNCSNGFCDADETTGNCCVDCGCTANQTCYGAAGVPDEQKSCVDPYCGDDFCDETLDHNSVPNEYWKNCCEDCGCHRSDVWEATKMEDHTIQFYRPTPDECYNKRCDGCNIDLNCNDGNNCTVDECLYNSYLNKTICVNVPITDCVNDDYCCPSNCTYANDNDCTGSCGDRKCEALETCENCIIDCGCDFGFECINETCQVGEGYCEVKGEVKNGAFCNGKNFVAQFDMRAPCEYDYECQGICKESVCSEDEISKESKEFYTKVGLFIVALAVLTAYFIIVIEKFWKS